MEAAFGAKPTVTYYDNHVVVDNEAGKSGSKATAESNFPPLRGCCAGEVSASYADGGVMSHG